MLAPRKTLAQLVQAGARIVRFVKPREIVRIPGVKYERLRGW
jgi:hypothetical protein